MNIHHAIEQLPELGITTKTEHRTTHEKDSPEHGMPGDVVTHTIYTTKNGIELRECDIIFYYEMSQLKSKSQKLELV